MAGWKMKIYQFGHIPARSLAQSAGDRKPPEIPEARGPYAKSQADICLNCTKKNCTGSESCFRKQKKEQQNGL
jgi:hypothetical protein